MDKELKVRKLASASVRRQRSQEREQRRQQLYEEREERKRQMMRMSNIYDNDTDGSDSSRPNSPENDSSADTPSEYGLRTPENSFSPKIEIKGQSIDSTMSQSFLKEDDPTTISKPAVETTTIPKPPSEPDTSPEPFFEPLFEPLDVSKLTLIERRRSRLDSPKTTMFTSSLIRPCDFRYDRFSTVIDPVELKRTPEEESSASSLSSAEESGDESTEDDSSGDEEDYSPIELATPVAIRMPITRPAVVSVVGISQQPGPQKFHVSNINTIMINPPKKPTPNPTIVESVPIPSSEVVSEPVFPVTQVKPEVLSPSSASIVSVEPSSTRSLSGISTASTDTNLKKKSSMPMLSRFTHARMHSIKNFMKPQSISGPAPAVPTIPPAHQPRPSESMANVLLSASSHRSNPSDDKTLPASPRRSLTELNIPRIAEEPQRPQTARAPSQSTLNTLCSQAQSDLSALPPPMPELPASWTSKSTQEEMDNAATNRKKSFQNLRRRSGSIGQALKFGSSSKTKVTMDEPLPPMPIAKPPIQEPVLSIQPIELPTPPTRTSRQFRKSGMNYSPFPQPVQRGEPVGLGLRM